MGLNMLFNAAKGRVFGETPLSSFLSFLWMMQMINRYILIECWRQDIFAHPVETRASPRFGLVACPIHVLCEERFFCAHCGMGESICWTTVFEIR